jgi:CysZ protein
MIVGAWLTAVQCVDHASENHGLPFSHTRTLLRRNPGPTIVFGSLAVGLLALPFFNVLVIPASVCAGTILWNVLHELSEKRTPTATTRQ